MLAQGQESARPCVDAGHSDREDRDCDRSVDDVWETADTGVDVSANERRGVGVVASTDQVRIIVRYQKADEGEGQDEDQTDSPEGHLDGTRKLHDVSVSITEQVLKQTYSLARIRVLGRSKPDELGTGKGEGCGDEDRAYTLEAICEGAWVVPQTGTPVLVVETVAGSASQNEDETRNQEDDDDGKLQDRAPEFLCKGRKRCEPGQRMDAVGLSSANPRDPKTFTITTRSMKRVM